MNRRNFIKKSVGGIALGGMGILAGCTSAATYKNHCGVKYRNGKGIAYAEGIAEPASNSERMTLVVDFKDRDGNILHTEKEVRMSVGEDFKWDYFVVWVGPKEKVKKMWTCDVSVSQTGKK